MGDIRCLQKGWGPTAACPMPDLACWRWGWTPGMGRSPLHAGEGALGAGEQALPCLPAAHCCPVRLRSAAGRRVAAAIPPWQGKLAVTHHPCWPCLPGDSSRTLSRGSCQPLCPPYGSSRGSRSCGALEGCWQGWLPPVGDVPWAWGWRDPMPCGKGCTIVTLLLCPGLVVPDPGQGQKKVILHPFFPASPHSGGNTQPTPPTGSLRPPAPGQCTRQGEGETLLGLSPSPEQCLGLSRALRNQHLTRPPWGSQGCAHPRGRMQAACAHIQGG